MSDAAHDDFRDAVIGTGPLCCECDAPLVDGECERDCLNREDNDDE